MKVEISEAESLAFHMDGKTKPGFIAIYKSIENVFLYPLAEGLGTKDDT